MDGGFPSENPTRESHQRIPPENPIRLLNRYPANNRWWHRSNVVSWYFMAWCDHQFVLINSDGFYWLIQPFGSAWRFGTWTLEDPTDPCGASTWRTTPSWSSAFPTRPTRNAFDHFPFFFGCFFGILWLILPPILFCAIAPFIWFTSVSSGGCVFHYSSPLGWWRKEIRATYRTFIFFNHPLCSAWSRRMQLIHPAPVVDASPNPSFH